MSLNEKYIINGSTLSDIGDALRTSGLISPTKEVTKSIWYRRDSGSASGSSTFTSTIDQSFFQQGNAVWDGTIAKVKIVITEGNPKINGAQYYSGNTVTVDVPCTISISGSRMYPMNFYSYSCKVFPLTSDGQNIDCTQPGNYGNIQSESDTISVLNTIAVEDIADAIVSGGAHCALIWPFVAENRGNGSNSTDLSNYISDITDIKALYWKDAGNYLNRLKPDLFGTTHYRNIGNYLEKDAYKVSYRTSTTDSANWEYDLDNPGNNTYEIFWDSGKLILVQSSGNTYAEKFPAVLFY